MAENDADLLVQIGLKEKDLYRSLARMESEFQKQREKLREEVYQGEYERSEVVP